MDAETLAEDVRLELRLMASTIDELEALAADVEGRAVTVRERAAAGAFLAQVYSGAENILKRIGRFYEVPLPEGEMWHLELFERFTAPTDEHLPDLLSAELASQMEPYRRFRHVIRHSYGLQLDWSRMEAGIGEVRSVFESFETCVEAFLETLGQ